MTGNRRQANPSTNLVGLDSSSKQSAQPIRRTPSFSRLSSDQHKQLLDEHHRKLQERRIAELTAQLESTIIQNQPEPSQSPQFQLPSTPTPHMKTIRPSSATNVPELLNSKPPLVSGPGPQAYFTTKQELLLWRQKQKEAEELNARIDTLRRSGLPQDQLPSPVRLPITPLLADLAEYETGSWGATSVGRSTRPCSPLVRSGSVAQPPSGLGSSTPKRTPSKPIGPTPRTVDQSPGLIMTAASGPTSVPDRGHLLGPSHDQAAYFNALKEAEDVITRLRSSHDGLLIKVTELESQLDQVEAENKNLRTRNQKLEDWLSEAEKEKARVEADERQRAKAQLAAEAQSQREAQARAEAQVRADNQARADEQARAESQNRAHRSTQSHMPHHSRPNPAPQFTNQVNQQQSREAQLRAKLQLRDIELGKQAVRQPFNLGSHPELTFANGPPLAHANQNTYYEPMGVANPMGQRLKRSTSFSGAPPRAFHAYQGLSPEEEALQIAMEKHQEALKRVQGIYREEVYGEMEWPSNEAAGTNYAPGTVDSYHGTEPIPRHH
ncbi:hypothetical protein CROQUDRAFT_42379 [Cronartium quercuum f. sp. fusiforme G11]|uniref:Uncharacterized protein n=1 Tax=Cronartium quercuum f. sp. fusiforme G11 TaxID=708437 RepID=A0A9P6TCV8_9BASI|nr:hypothetical protein CROQUDRAFT_42379 [Cronartium quercuum f. sp. fusiforme G11]